MKKIQAVILVSFCLMLLSCNSNDYDTKLVILSTTDLHGHVFPWDYYANEPDDAHSMIKAASVVDSVRALHPNTLLLDAGDWLQGNPFAEYYARVDSTLTYPLLDAAVFMEYDAFVIGNHEFNFGIDLLNKRIEEAGFPFLGANIRHADTGEAAYTPFIIRDVDGFSTAIIGVTTPGSAIWDRPRVEDRLDFGDGLEFAQKYVDEVKSMGAEVIIILAHSGYETGSSYTSEHVPVENFGQQIAEKVEGVHALILGHRHRIIDDRTVKTDANPQGIAVTMAGRWASHVGHTELLLSRDEDGNAVVRFGNNKAIPVAGYPVHAELAELMQGEHERVREFITEPVAQTTSEWSAYDGRLYDRPITDLIQHVQKKVTGADLSVASVFNPSASFGPGGITRGDLAGLYPYENTLFKLEIDGKTLREFLEFSARYYAQTDPGLIPEPAGVTPGYNFDVVSGVEYEMDLSEPVGSRIKNLTYNNRPVQDSQKFTIAINSYRAVGGGDYDMISNARVVRVFDRSVRSFIEEYLRDKGTIEPEEVSNINWKILNLPEY